MHGGAQSKTFGHHCSGRQGTYPAVALSKTNHFFPPVHYVGENQLVASIKCIKAHQGLLQINSEKQVPKAMSLYSKYQVPLRKTVAGTNTSPFLSVL